LSRLLTRMGSIRGINSVLRVGDEATVKQKPPT
jgi:hypothetical protein